MDEAEQLFADLRGQVESGQEAGKHPQEAPILMGLQRETELTWSDLDWEV